MDDALWLICFLSEYCQCCCCCGCCCICFSVRVRSVLWGKTRDLCIDPANMTDTQYDGSWFAHSATIWHYVSWFQHARAFMFQKRIAATLGYVVHDSNAMMDVNCYNKVISTMAIRPLDAAIYLAWSAVADLGEFGQSWTIISRRHPLHIPNHLAEIWKGDFWPSSLVV